MHALGLQLRCHVLSALNLISNILGSPSLARHIMFVTCILWQLVLNLALIFGGKII